MILQAPYGSEAWNCFVRSTPSCRASNETVSFRNSGEGRNSSDDAPRNSSGDARHSSGEGWGGTPPGIRSSAASSNPPRFPLAASSGRNSSIEARPNNSSGELPRYGLIAAGMEGGAVGSNGSNCDLLRYTSGGSLSSGPLSSGSLFGCGSLMGWGSEAILASSAGERAERAERAATRASGGVVPDRGGQQGCGVNNEGFRVPAATAAPAPGSKLGRSLSGAIAAAGGASKGAGGEEQPRPYLGRVVYANRAFEAQVRAGCCEQMRQTSAFLCCELVCVCECVELHVVCVSVCVCVCVCVCV
jgi:hypothetical protein